MTDFSNIFKILGSSFGGNTKKKRQNNDNDNDGGGFSSIIPSGVLKQILSRVGKGGGNTKTTGNRRYGGSRQTAVSKGGSFEKGSTLLGKRKNRLR